MNCRTIMVLPAYATRSTPKRDATVRENKPSHLTNGSP
jgi:hypothetical protein